MPERGAVAEHFPDAGRQHEAAMVGMWIFLATEVLLFGALFNGYLVYRRLHPEAFTTGAGLLHDWLAAANTLVLLTSSLTMALAVHAAQTGRRTLVRWLLATAGLGLVFLGLKAWEYTAEYQAGLMPFPGLEFQYTGESAGAVQLFFNLYYTMTGLHALHVTIGVGVLAVIARAAHRRRYSPEYYNPVEVAGLYWHFVDVVWIFLFPLLYLINR